MDKKNIALICGSGAVENAWLPLDFLKPHHFKKNLSKEGANSALALLVYNLRFHENRSNGNEDDPIYKTCKEMLNKLRNDICENIKYCQENKKISVRNEFNNIIEKMILPDCKRLLLVTTNWDTVVEEALKSNSILKFFIRNKTCCIHLHGSYDDPEGIYLPTEFINEKYRTEEQRFRMGRILEETMENLTDAQILIIYGLSISPLDAELLQVLGTSISVNANLEVVKIIDPNHECVAEKINIILKDSSKIKVEGFSPENLVDSINHTLD